MYEARLKFFILIIGRRLACLCIWVWEPGGGGQGAGGKLRAILSFLAFVNARVIVLCMKMGRLVGLGLEFSSVLREFG